MNDMQNSRPDIVTTREAATRSKSDGMPVSEYTLRRWVRLGVIPAARCGKKALLYYPNVLAYLKTGELPKQPERAGLIRRVEVHETN